MSRGRIHTQVADLLDRAVSEHENDSPHSAEQVERDHLISHVLPS